MNHLSLSDLTHPKNPTPCYSLCRQRIVRIDGILLCDLGVLKGIIFAITEFLVIQYICRWELIGAAQIRGEVKAKADNLIDKYDILSSTNKAIVKVRVRWLLGIGQRQFTYGGIKYEPEMKSDPQQPLSHEGIVRLLEKQWFKTGHSEGLRYFKKFNTIPNPLIALAMTSMEASLTQWEDGGLVKSQFSETKWRHMYHSHLVYINTLGDNSPKWMANYKSRFLKRVCSHAGIDADGVVQAPDITSIDFASLEALVEDQED
ncbi:hypothetical protein JAAARDRAFT_195126 [Jaapia argillacea MUCL 33604]|uniref:DUF6532 domain-containing protein n=1 Tax=Jaapia argillacea MUCL 33604 TaxID=933084 RepID=A0A067Q1N1_9AGAM|nr:hypothetical protein JAAARDRAFT_195126 [Jaapia argillacea MUCL 33604]